MSHSVTIWINRLCGDDMDRVERVSLLAVFLAMQGILAGSVAADEAFLCEGGRIVYVKFGDLERLKRTDACIAGYFGLKVEVEDKASDRAAAAGKALEAGPAAKAPPPKFRTLNEPAHQRAAYRVNAGRTAQAVPAAAPAADYRNVSVINASDAASAVFAHRR